MTKRNIQVGDIFSEQQFYKVVGLAQDTMGRPVSEVKMLDGSVSAVSNSYIDDNTSSADIFVDVEYVSASQLSAIVLANPMKAMTVNFNKKLKETDLLNKITQRALGLHNAEISPTNADFEDLMTLRGDERTMRGYHEGKFTPASRLIFNDMDVTDGQSRQVDLRTANYAICGGVKYVIKPTKVR